jgi:Fic family protein
MDNNTFSIVPDKATALYLAKRQLAELVFDAVNLEGILYTLPEVQTLLDGVTVGGHRLSDERITLNQASAWKFLFHAIEVGEFSLSKAFATRLHDIAAKEESLTWGKFRDSQVTVAGTDYMPPAADSLDTAWELMLEASEAFADIYDRAIYVFLQMARNQFFFDVNKRMGRFMMNGLLLSKGYPVINLPAKRQLEFNQLMLAFYMSNDVEQMIKFMKSCLDPKYIAIMNERAPDISKAEGS